MKNQVKIVNLTLLNKIVDYSVNIHPLLFIFWLLSLCLSSDYFFNPTQVNKNPQMLHPTKRSPNSTKANLPILMHQQPISQTKPAKHPNQKHHQKIEARFTYLFRSVFPFIISTCRPQTTPAKMASSDNTTNHL